MMIDHCTCIDQQHQNFWCRNCCVYMEQTIYHVGCRSKQKWYM